MAQFVPLKVETKGEVWSKWVTKYRFEGKGIPIIYIIRADGKMLYGKSGAMRNEALMKFMQERLAESGRAFNEKEYELLASTLDEVEKLRSNGDMFGAVRRLSVLSKLGKPGQFGGHSTIAGRADGVVKELIATATIELKEAEEKIAEEETRFDGALKLAQTKRLYSTLPEVGPKVIAAYRKAERNADYKEAITQANQADRANAALRLRSGKKSAVTAFTRLIQRNPGKPVAAYAKARLAEITGEPVADDPPSARPASPEYRTWTSSGGGFKIEAVLVSVTDGVAQLKRRNGKILLVPLSKLSAADRKFAAKQ